MRSNRKSRSCSAEFGRVGLILLFFRTDLKLRKTGGRGKEGWIDGRKRHRGVNLRYFRTGLVGCEIRHSREKIYNVEKIHAGNK